MVSLVVPTRNRCYTLRLVARSWYAQRNLDEIVFVDDCGEDDTRAFVDELKLEFSSPTTKYLRNPVRRGAAASRSVGVAHANGGYVCFCDDDEYLEGDYLIGCLEYLERTGVGAVSGRRLYMNVGETIAQTIARCGSGEEGRPYFKSWLCEVDDRGFLAAVESLPLVNAIISGSMITIFGETGIAKRAITKCNYSCTVSKTLCSLAFTVFIFPWILFESVELDQLGSEG